jgi:hypothetical protein
MSGWSGYIAEHMKEGTVNNRELVPFLNMWLEKFVLCGKTFGPTANYQIVAEQWAVGSRIPLGKYLLGAVYNLLHQVAVSLSTNSPIGTPGGPWWFLNMWLNLHLRDMLEQNIFDVSFPGDQLEGVPIVKRRCMNFGEIVSVFPGHKRTPSRIAEHFRSFYLGFTPGSITWFAYRDDDDTHFETTFNFDNIHRDDDNRIAFVEMIKSGFLPSCVFGKDQSATYEFYNPSVCTRPLGLSSCRLAFTSLI